MSRDGQCSQGCFASKYTSTSQNITNINTWNFIWECNYDSVLSVAKCTLYNPSKSSPLEGRGHFYKFCIIFVSLCLVNVMKEATSGYYRKAIESTLHICLVYFKDKNIWKGFFHVRIANAIIDFFLNICFEKKDFIHMNRIVIIYVTRW